MGKTNKEIREAIFKELKEHQIEVINPSIGNGYYLFNFGEESVVHFHIKGCKRWLWGMWITHDENKTNIDLFGEHEDYIDKFKPTRTAIAVKTEISDNATEEQWENEINNVVWDLCYEKLLIVHSSNIAGKIKFYYGGSENIVRWLLSQWWFYRIRNPFQKRLKYKGNKYICIFICFILNLFYRKRLNAEYKKTDFFHPAYEIYIRYKKGVDDDMIWSIYKHICNDVGFNKSIRINHIPCGEKRGIFFKINA